MSRTHSVKTAARMLATAFPVLLGLLFLPGCETDRYPQELIYPPRTDPLIIGRADQDSRHIDLPGDFPGLFIGLEAAQRAKLLLDPISQIKPDQRQQLDATLLNLFGTPANPKVDGIDAAMRDALRLDAATLVEGSRVYRHQCLHCHGLSGDGRGATSPWVNPHPRDFREGRFKFTSTGQDEGERKARREDLLRTLREGIDGASMPSFRLLDDNELEAVASYVMHLSLRGETEAVVLKDLAEVRLESAGAEDVQAYLTVFAGRWMAAQANPIMPGPYKIRNDTERQAAAKRGFDLFIKAGEAGCIACHTDFGRQSPWKYDAWGTMVKPTDLTRGTYRGGRRPVDLYYRVHSGVNGSGMTAFGKNLQSDQIWDLVAFLQILPYPQMRKAYAIDID